MVATGIATMGFGAQSRWDWGRRADGGFVRVFGSGKAGVPVLEK